MNIFDAINKKKKKPEEKTESKPAEAAEDKAVMEAVGNFKKLNKKKNIKSKV